MTAPIGVTLWLAWKVVGLVDDGIRPMIPVKWHPSTYLPFDMPGFGILVVLTGLTLLGALTTGLVGRLLVKYSEWLLTHIPVISSIYRWMRQIFETLLSEESTAFREVVLIEYPCRGSWAVGFLTGQTEGEVQQTTSETVYNVFVPATPNPTTGFLLFIPERDIRRLEMTTDQGLKLVVSGGIVKPVEEEEESIWGHGTGIADEVERIKATLSEERRLAESEAVWGHGTGIADEVERIKSAMELANPSAWKTATLLGRLRDYLFAGALVTAPIAVTFWLVFAVVDTFDRIVVPLFPAAWNPANYLPFGIPGLGLIATIISMILIGFLTAGFMGDAVVRLGERLIEGLPVVRGVYSAVKQIFESVLKKQSTAFREVALVQYPRPDSWAIGFLTGDAAQEIKGHAEADSINVFLPTTPNPTSGFLLFLPRDQVRNLSMTVEQGLKMVISGGLVTPESDVQQEEEDTSSNGEAGSNTAAGRPSEGDAR